LTRLKNVAKIETWTTFGNKRRRKRNTVSVYSAAKQKLTDLARKYRKLNAELDPTDARSSRLSEFYKAETRDIDQEILQLDNRTVN
jgi:vacuolar-type H+-ATPase subunit I/STV1